MKAFKGFQNCKCEFFPCHKIDNNQTINCMFCYCPLYLLEDCGGNFFYLGNGIKDCSRCLKIHDENSYDFVQSKMLEVLEKAKQTLQSLEDNEDDE
ncbi:hypothetical protein AN639_12670 [Candidatus Epulonipiscium fishelsonii]|uniref:Uncharacterized protein n=1 Tax=Candidatus Epulonipiscium fishelsonii TaxID=77094 RepID=A0ACC8XGH5_9FIRM|nr:hypothetical protein AN639_12670 [Epulopiscium sp. SCG-B05WGA-EpuloA1]ONI42699.1 hypothetical protein AN396_13490 [Epulopiscium sp. SCG-B11WGA-EpuloA1]